MILKFQDLSNSVHFMTKMRQDNDATNCTSSLYLENETKLSCLIRKGTVYDEDQIGQRHD